MGLAHLFSYVAYRVIYRVISLQYLHFLDNKFNVIEYKKI